MRRMYSLCALDPTSDATSTTKASFPGSSMRPQFFFSLSFTLPGGQQGPSRSFPETLKRPTTRVCQGFSITQVLPEMYHIVDVRHPLVQFHHSDVTTTSKRQENWESLSNNVRPRGEERHSKSHVPFQSIVSSTRLHQAMRIRAELSISAPSSGSNVMFERHPLTSSLGISRILLKLYRVLDASPALKRFGNRLNHLRTRHGTRLGWKQVWRQV